jgi:hypothetical protein
LLAANEFAMGGSPPLASNASILEVARSKGRGPSSLCKPYAEPVKFKLLMAEATFRNRSVAPRLKAGAELLVF